MEPAERTTARPGNADGRPLLVVLRALGLGDFLAAVPALRALTGAFPDHRRVLAAPRALTPLVALAGVADAVADTAPLVPLDESLRGADIAVNLHGRGPQSHRLLLASEPGCLISFSHPGVPESAGGPVWRAEEHEVRRWCRMLEESGVPADPADLELPAPPRPVPQAARGATLIHPGAASPARRWPQDRWSAVARAEAADGRSVILTGGPDEVDLARTVARGAGLDDSAVYAGRTDLVGLAALVAAAGRVACGDTGVAHLATALRTPSVVLFGPVPPSEWGPPDRPWHRALWAGRTGDPHARRPDPGLLKLRVSDATRALAGLPGIAEKSEPGADRSGSARVRIEDEAKPEHGERAPGRRTEGDKWPPRSS